MKSKDKSRLICIDILHNTSDSMWMDVSTILVYAGFYLFIIFISLGIGTRLTDRMLLDGSSGVSGIGTTVGVCSVYAACALYYVAELVEEYLKTAKRLLEYVVKATVVANLALLIDGMPIYCVACGVVSQVLYYRALQSKRFPYLDMLSPEILTAFLGCMATSGLWVRYFWHSRYSNEYVASFMLTTTWLVPFVLSLCLAGGENALPGAGGIPPPASSMGSPFVTAAPLGSHYSRNGQVGSSSREKKRRGWALQILDFLGKKSKEGIESMPLEPAMMPKEKI